MEIYFRSQDEDEEPEIIYSDDLDCHQELIFDENIPAEFEEEVVCESFIDPIEEIISTPVPSPHPRSLLLPHSEVKFKQTLSVNRSLLKTNQKQLEAQKSVDASQTTTHNQSKFRQTVNFKPTNFVLNEQTMKIFKNKIKAIQKRKAQAMAREKKQRPKKVKLPPMPSASHSVKKPVVKKPEPVNYIPQKPKPIVDPKNSGEIVRVEKAESDIEVDILSNSEEDLPISPPLDDDGSESTEEISIDDGSWMNEKYDATGAIDETDGNDETQRRIEELKESDEATYQLLESSLFPEMEATLESSNISNLERFFHSEFFMQRPTKTPERYLKIRNHILDMWHNFRPNYLSKTAARNGLKKCGDVNCISRIHSMLEQIGAINFNCREVQWIRPLRILYEIFQQNIRNKNLSSRISHHEKIMEKKQRIRNSTNIFGAGAQDANFTISHDDASMISIESSDSMVNRIKSRTQHRTQFELIKCQRFSKDNVAPFQVTMSLSCLLCLYFHALSSKLEVNFFIY
jgi:hypothetical protein